jgi:hypothetical protein
MSKSVAVLKRYRSKRMSLKNGNGSSRYGTKKIDERRWS